MFSVWQGGGQTTQFERGNVLPGKSSSYPHWRRKSGWCSRKHVCTDFWNQCTFFKLHFRFHKSVLVEHGVQKLYGIIFNQFVTSIHNGRQTVCYRPCSNKSFSGAWPQRALTVVSIFTGCQNHSYQNTFPFTQGSHNWHFYFEEGNFSMKKTFLSAFLFPKFHSFDAYNLWKRIHTYELINCNGLPAEWNCLN